MENIATTTTKTVTTTTMVPEIDSSHSQIPEANTTPLPETLEQLLDSNHAIVHKPEDDDSARRKRINKEADDDLRKEVPIECFTNELRRSKLCHEPARLKFAAAQGIRFFKSQVESLELVASDLRVQQKKDQELIAELRAALKARS
jgi:hypothetical protein